MIGYPLDSKVTFNEAGIPEFDRAISSAPLRTLIGKLFSNGVLPNPSTNLQVVAGTSGMTVVVKKGFAIVNGCLKLEETDRTLTLQASETNYDRIDTIVVRLNDESNARYCDLYVVTGTPATNPVRPELTRNASVYEIGLADIFVSKNTSTITQQRITDTRYETDRCGIISSISEFDTTTLYEQIQSDLADFKTEEQADFIAWFENIKTILDGNVAGHLQNEIDALDTRVTANENAITSHDTDIAQLTDDVSKKASQKLVGEEYTIPAGLYNIPGTYTVFNDEIYRCKLFSQGSPAAVPSAWEKIGSVTQAIESNDKKIELLGLKTVNFSGSAQLTANQATEIYTWANGSAPSGYKILGVIGYGTGANGVYFRGVKTYNNAPYLIAYSQTTIQAAFDAIGLYIKETIF